MKQLNLFAGLFFLSTTVSVSPAIAQDRGQQLYENHCISCHESTVHIRDDRKAATLADIRYQAERWRGVLDLSWTKEEVNDVVNYLNNRYYQYQPDTQTNKK